MVAGPRRRKAACLSTAGKAEERKAIAQKTGHGFMGEMRKNRKRRKQPISRRLMFFTAAAIRKKGKKNGGRSQNRTGDTGIFSPLRFR